MSGGKGGKSKTPSLQQQLQAQQQAIEMSRPKEVQLQTSGWGGMGVNAPQNPMQMGTGITGRGMQAPAWASGDWAMPWWGQQAPNVGAAMMQAQDPQAWARMTQGMQAPPWAQGQQGAQGAQGDQSSRPPPAMSKARKMELIRQSLASQGYPA